MESYIVIENEVNRNLYIIIALTRRLGLQADIGCIYIYINHDVVAVVSEDLEP